MTTVETTVHDVKTVKVLPIVEIDLKEYEGTTKETVFTRKIVATDESGNEVILKVFGDCYRYLELIE